MSKFVTDLNSVLKYQQEQERQAFEKAIDANPLESTNHLVYADWLDEQGEPEEAAFRRAMGDWYHKNSDIPRKMFPKGYQYVGPEEFKWSSPLVTHPHTVAGRDLPTFVSHIPSYDMHVDPEPSDNSIPHYTYGGDRYYWKTYRGMESALRKAFQAGRQNTSA
jgi:uncharacterized protein (TIGR02996 family)